jgi:thymidylate kinase
MIVLVESDRCVIIDATQPKPEVADRIWKAVNDRLQPATAPVALEGAAL